jgi:uncharacterized coiled-coil protein SlyX
MADDNNNLEAHQELDIRIREIEISHSSLSSTIVSMNVNITEMKQMFQKFLIDSERISEMAGKIESITKLEKETSAIGSKYDELYRKFVVLEHTCTICPIGKVDTYIRDIGDKVNRIEVTLGEMKETKGKFSGFWNNISQTIITLVIIYVLYLVAMNIQSNGNPLQNAPSIKGPAASSYVEDANASDAFKNISAVKLKGAVK